MTIVERLWPAPAARTSHSEESNCHDEDPSHAACCRHRGVALAVPPAIAASTACGSGCISFYPLSTGTGDVLAVSNPSRGAYTGEPVTIAAASSTNNGEDWFLDEEDPVLDFYEAGLMSAEMNLHWGSDEAYEIDYAPGGDPSGLCMGTSTSNGSGAVTLQPCGETAATLWVADTADQDGRAVPLINGNNNNYAYPYSLEAGSAGAHLTSNELLADPDFPPSTSQEWGTIYGVL
jgi:hypothetical protein